MIRERRPNDYAQRNLLLQVTLGLLAAGERLDELLARHAPPRNEPAGEPEPAVWTILGLIALRERLTGVLAEVPPPAPQEAPSEAAGELEGLLR